VSGTHGANLSKQRRHGDRRALPFSLGVPEGEGEGAELTAPLSRRIWRATTSFRRVWDMDRIAGRFLALSALGAVLLAAAPARADLRMCNNTSNRVSVALAYTDGQGWVSEGWWNLKSLDCATLLRGALAAQYYYVYAMDERGGEWKGKAFMCTSDREFKIEGRQDCYVRGYDRTGFFEVDTGKDAKSWTVQLTDQASP
jgi:uncharacterized membrane protein